MRELKREHAIIECLLNDVLEAGSWANESTKEYVRNHMISNVWQDWFPQEWRDES